MNLCQKKNQFEFAMIVKVVVNTIVNMIANMNINQIQPTSKRSPDDNPTS